MSGCVGGIPTMRKQLRLIRSQRYVLRFLRIAHDLQCTSRVESIAIVIITFAAHFAAHF